MKMCERNGSTGRIVLMSPASLPHQRLSAFLVQLMQSFAEVHQLGVVLPAPFQMKTGPELPGREPDILFPGGKETLDRLGATHLRGPADWPSRSFPPKAACGIVARSSPSMKWAARRGVLDSRSELECADFYQLGGDGRYRRVGVDTTGTTSRGR